jgi:small GTP-binding protein
MANYWKVILVGDAAVGKTSILNSMMNRFSPCESTVGCNCQMISVEHAGKNFPLQIWDTAGQEMYRSLIPAYFRGVDVSVIVFDVTSASSFESVGFWLDTVKDHAVNTPILLVANKIDLTDWIAVPASNIPALSNLHSIELAQTSAKTGDGISELVASIATLLEERKRIEIAPVESPKSSCCL